MAGAKSSNLFYTPDKVGSWGLALFGAVIGFFTGGFFGAATGFTIGWNIPNLMDSTFNNSDNYDDKNTLDTNAVLATCYGQVRRTGNIMRVYNSDTDAYLKVAVSIAKGAINSYESVYINDIAWADLESGTYAKTEYLGGWGQVPDDARWAFDGHVSAYKGVAYISYFLENTGTVGASPHLSCIIKGKNCLVIGATSLTDAGTYKWTNSGAGTDEYICEALAGGDPGLNSGPLYNGSGVLGNNLPYTEGVIGSLAVGQWAWGVYDPGGLDPPFNTIHIRLPDGTDPDTKATDYLQKTKFSRNSAVVLHDFQVTEESVPLADIDLTSFQALETYCDVVPAGGSVPRYRCDVVFDNDIALSDAKKLIWASFHGMSFYDQGKLKVVWDQANATTSHAFTMNTIVENSFSWKQTEKINSVTITYLDSANEYKEDYISVKDQIDITDNYESPYEEVDLFITDKEIAQRRARFIFDNFKYKDYTCMLTGLPNSQDLEISDKVTITHSGPGWTAKEFIVVDKAEDFIGRPSFVFEAYYGGIYGDLSVADQVAYYSDLPNPNAPMDPCTNLALVENGYINETGKYTPSVLLTFDKPLNRTFWHHADLELKTENGADPHGYELVGQDASGLGYSISGTTGHQFKVGETVTVRVNSVNQLGVKQTDDNAATRALKIVGATLSDIPAPRHLRVVGAPKSNSYEWNGVAFTMTWTQPSSTGGLNREHFSQELLGFGGMLDSTTKGWLAEIWVDGVKKYTSELLMYTGFPYTVCVDNPDDPQAVYFNGVGQALRETNGTFTFKVATVDWFNRISDYTEAEFTHETPAMATPSGTQDTTGLTFDWDDDYDRSIRGYSVSTYTDSGRTALLVNDTCRDTRYFLSRSRIWNLASGSNPSPLYMTFYKFNIFGQHSADVEVESGLISVVAPPPMHVPLPTISGLEIKWDTDNNPDVTGYNIYIDTTSPPTTFRSFTNGNTYTYFGLPNTLYYTKVTAVTPYGETALGSASAESGTTLSITPGYFDLDTPILTGITWTSDATDISWSSGTLVYEGVSYSITADSGTGSNPYVYWNKNSAPTTFTSSATRPTLGDDIWVMAFYNVSADEIYPAEAHKLMHAGLIQANSITAGEITAGTITGTEISASARIVAGTGNNIGVLDGADATYRIYAGHDTPGSAPFRVTQAGALTATSATITGSITSTSGAIGGWTIGATTLTGGNLTLDSGNTKITAGTGDDIIAIDAVDATYRLAIGDAVYADAPFSVAKTGALVATNATITGSLTATTGAIGGWTVGATTLTGGDLTLDSGNTKITAGTGDDIIAIDAADATYRLAIGDAVYADAPFSVSKAGVLVASSATITGTINATAGAFTGALTLGDGATTSGTLTMSLAAGQGDVFIASGKTDFTNTDAGFILGIDDSDSDTSKFYIGDSSSYLNWTGSAFNLHGCSLDVSSITALTSGSEIGIQGWQYDGAFSATDNDTVAWASGTLTLMNDVVYHITGANTGDIAALTYIYLDIATSTTLFQTSTTAGDAVGTGKILVAVATNVAAGKEATYQVFGGIGGQNVLIGTDNITAASVTTDEIAATTIVAGNIAANTITANEIAAATITTTEIAADTIVAGNIAATTITSAEMVVGTLVGTELAATAKITAGTGTDVAVLDGDDATYRIYAGDAVPADAPFSVTKAGALVATSATITGTITSVAGTGQRTVIDATTFKWFNVDNDEVINIDANIYGAIPGIKITNGILSNYEDNDNFTYINPGNILQTSTDTAYAISAICAYNAAVDTTAIKGLYQVAVDSTDGAERVGVLGNAQITISAANDSTLIGVKGTVSSSSAGATLYSGYFEGGDFFVTLGDAAGTNKISINDSADAGIFTVNSNGRISSDSGNTYILLGDNAGVDAFIIEDSDAAEVFSVNSDGATTFTGAVSLTDDAIVTKSLWLNVTGLKAPGTKPATLIDYGIGDAWEFSDSTDDTLVSRIKLPDDMDKSVGMTILIGWNTPTLTAGNAKWDVEYLYRQENEWMAAGADATLTATVACSGTGGGLLISSLGTTAVPHADDACITVRIKRRADEAADTISAVCYLFGVCFNYKSNKLGS